MRLSVSVLRMRSVFSRLTFAVTLVVLEMSAGCASAVRQGQIVAPPVSWTDTTTVLAEPDPNQTLAAWQEGSTATRIRRLDVLLDLFDLARFGDDAATRETLWIALGGHPSGRGSSATREASARLLDEALRLEDASDFASLPEDDARFVADAIMLLSNDLATPASAEDLVTRTLAQRQLVEYGHPRVADNAHWRLYDHVRGTLVGATQAPPRARYDIAVQALYARAEDLAELLSDAPPIHAPAKPSPQELLVLADEHLAELERIPAWAALARARRQQDEALRDTVLGLLPAERSPSWPLPKVPASTGRADMGAPVVTADRDGVAIDAGRPHAQRFAWSSFDARRAAQVMQAAAASDGRSALLLALDPELPAPDLAALLNAVRDAQVGTLELAAREPHMREQRTAVTALPLQIVRDPDAGPGARTLRASRVHVHLSGYGPRFAVDGRSVRVPERTPWDLLAAAFPRERAVRLTLADDIVVPQLVDVLAELVGGEQPRFEAAAWSAEGSPPRQAPDAAQTDLLQARARWRSMKFALEQPYPLTDEDQTRLENAAARASVCLPELENSDLEKPLVVVLEFDAHRVQQLSVAGARLGKAVRSRLEDCLRQELLGLRLFEHAERMTVRLLTTST